MLKVAICDNDPQELQYIKSLVSIYDDFELYTYQKSALLEHEILTGNEFDIYLLDVVMPEPNGIELAQRIRKFDLSAIIIFLTNHDEHALDAFGVRAFQYLLKPIEPRIFYGELDMARSFILRRNQTLFPLKTKAGLQAIPFHKIAYCRLESRCIVCVLSDGGIEKSVTLRVPFGRAVAPLLQDIRFIRPHISFVVNMDQISSMQEKDFQMKDGTLIPIAQNSHMEMKERYFLHVFGGEA